MADINFKFIRSASVWKATNYIVSDIFLPRRQKATAEQGNREEGCEAACLHCRMNCREKERAYLEVVSRDEFSFLSSSLSPFFSSFFFFLFFLIVVWVGLSGSGKLNFDSFYRVACHFQEEDDEALQKELKEAFRLYDKEGNGYIPTSSLREILAALDDQITPDQMDGMIAEIDTDGSGTVDFDGEHLFLQLWLL